MNQPTRIVILGGGFAGAYCALRLARVSGDGFAVTVLDRQNYLLFYPLLVEAGTGSLEPRHATVPLRVLLRNCVYRMGDVLNVDFKNARITYKVAGESPTLSADYDHLVLALGSVTNLPPVKGLNEFGFYMKSLTDAVSLRDRMLQLLERADAIEDDAERRRLLHVVVVGGNFTGVEVAGEYMDFLQRMVRLYPTIDPDDIRMSLIERADRILGPLEPDLARYAAGVMARKGIKFSLNESISEIGPDFAVLASGGRIETNTVIWCAGIAPNPLLRSMNLPSDKAGWILCEPDGRVKGFTNVWGAGDCAVNPDPAGRPYSATAQAAVKEGAYVAKNIVRASRGQATRPIEFKLKGSVTPLGGHNAVVTMGKFHFSGVLGWLVYRAFYLKKIPGFARKARVALDWVGSMFTQGDAVQLKIHPRRPTGLPERRDLPETTGVKKPS